MFLDGCSSNVISVYQRERLYNVPTMVATEHYIHVWVEQSKNVPSLLEAKCYIIRSMSNNLRMLYQCYYMECKIENTIELSGNVLSMLFV